MEKYKLLIKNGDIAMLQRYLGRINSKIQEPSLESLSALQREHYEAVPYENIDILLGKALDLNPEIVYKKVVEDGRGGYCFELNGLYAKLLTELGYKFTQRLGRFLLGEAEGFIPMGRHRILVVELDGKKYLTDVGIGCPTPTLPLELAYDKIQVIDNVEYKIVEDSVFKNILKYKHHGVWENYYAFGNEENYDNDFIAPSLYCELSPDSIFNKGTMVHIYTKCGRISMDKNQVKHFENGKVDVKLISCADEMKKELKDNFRINVSIEEAKILFKRNLALS